MEVDEPEINEVKRNLSDKHEKIRRESDEISAVIGGIKSKVDQDKAEKGLTMANLAREYENLDRTCENPSPRLYKKHKLGPASGDIFEESRIKDATSSHPSQPENQSFMEGSMSNPGNQKILLKSPNLSDDRDG